VQWVATYLQESHRYSVFFTIRPGQIAQSLAQHPPEHGERLEKLLRDVDTLIMPGITHWNHPGFFAYFGITGSAPGVMGEFIAAALNVNAMLWRTSPAATELEQRTLRWVAQMMGLPDTFFGEILDTASSSTFCALAAAREAAGLDIRNRGMAGRSDLPPLAIYTSSEAHSSVDKAAIALGFGRDFTRRIEVDDAYRMRPDRLSQAIESDLAKGIRPIAVVATTGTTSTTSVDPVRAIADICQQHDLWLHVDAAYGGSAAIVPELRWVLEGCERADSLVTNPHKWMLTPIDCSLLYTRHPDALKRAFSLVADYLATDDGDVTNLMDYGLALGRRFRSLKLWFVIRAYGRSGIAHIIERHVALANELATQIDDTPGWERLAPTPLSTVCFRHVPPSLKDADAHNQAIVNKVNASGEVFVSSTKLRGSFAIRLAIGNASTRRQHVQRAWELLQKAAAETSSP
ncbi:MAG TPA: pyridoxal-dependent decarboxylase, partial [Polyangiaceae bacterium]|nr:pyridoxal-dependent decarboxylase [Polyangiaceae bacterium]